MPCIHDVYDPSWFGLFFSCFFINPLDIISESAYFLCISDLFSVPIQ